MVVNRKQPIVPPTPVSRSASSQSVPTKKRTRIPNVINPGLVPEPTRDNANAQKYVALPLVSRKSKSQKPVKKRQRNSFVDYLFLTALSTFTLYAYFTCQQSLSSPSLYQTDPPLCRALSTCRTHIIEPFILPPVKYTQRVSEPYISSVQARLSPYFEPGRRSLDALSPYAKVTRLTAQKLWHNTVKPLYTDTLKPYYNTALLPRYNRYIQPRLVPLRGMAERYFAYYVYNPIRTQTNFMLQNLLRFYIFHVDSYVRVARPHIYAVGHTITGLTQRLSRTYTNRVYPLLLKMWARLRPIFCAVWRQSMALLTHLSNAVVALFTMAAKEASMVRRQYVDPHVDRIFEQVDSKGNGIVKSTETQTADSVIRANNPSDTRNPQTAVLETPTEAIFEPLVTPTSDQKGQTTLVVEGTSIDHEKIPVDTLEKEVHDITTTQVPLAIPTGLTMDHDTHGPTDSGCPACVAAATVVPTSVSYHEQDAELDDFLRDLGVDEQPSVAPGLPNTDSEGFNENWVPPQVKSEEERLAETAAKRADIVGRHEKWFERLHAGVKEKGDELVKTLQALRDSAAEEVAGMGRAGGTETETMKDSKSLAGVEQDGEKFLRGLEVYLRKAEARSAQWKIQKDAPKDDEANIAKQDLAAKEKDKFVGILSKVDNKFSDRINSVRRDIHQWYVDLREREAQEVLSASEAIKIIASRAQEDLAMDYAWLDDVTYMDWQRYHELMRIHDTFEVTVRQIANGTSTDPQPPSDSVVPALDELDKELQDVILGFNYAMSGIRSRGLKVFKWRPLTDSGDDEDDDGFFVVRDNERRIVDLRGVDLGKIEMKKEAVGVLPVSEEKESTTLLGVFPLQDVPRSEDSRASVDVSKLIVAKDKVQIEQALKNIPLEPAAQRHEEL